MLFGKESSETVLPTRNKPWDAVGRLWAAVARLTRCVAHGAPIYCGSEQPCGFIYFTIIRSCRNQFFGRPWRPVEARGGPWKPVEARGGPWRSVEARGPCLAHALALPLPLPWPHGIFGARCSQPCMQSWPWSQRAVKEWSFPKICLSQEHYDGGLRIKCCAAGDSRTLP